MCILVNELSLSLSLCHVITVMYLVDRLTVPFMNYCCILHNDTGDDFNISTCLSSDPSTV